MNDMNDREKEARSRKVLSEWDENKDNRKGGKGGFTVNDFMTPNLIIKLKEANYLTDVEAVKLYIMSSVILNERNNNKEKDNKKTYISTRTISEKLNISLDTVQNIIKRHMNIIQRTKSKGERKRQWIVIGTNDHILEKELKELKEDLKLVV